MPVYNTLSEASVYSEAWVYANIEALIQGLVD
jgi:hypothetical protein